MITFKDGFFYTPLLDEGTYLKKKKEYILKGINEEDYKKLKEETKKEEVRA